MDAQVVVDIMQDSFQVALFLALPALLAALTVGVLVSVFQSVTSIQEQTLVFVPKMLAVMLVLIASFSWMLHMVIGFTRRLLESIPQYLQ
ncbi:flagellar biosynthesis protein FliQ [Candidatus Sumerlaeota bacterium]|nr:flagellar biosynthesis protein FliQ [Candidatus Sumerlaeota bacterium]